MRILKIFSLIFILINLTACQTTEDKYYDEFWDKYTEITKPIANFMEQDGVDLDNDEDMHHVSDLLASDEFKKGIEDLQKIVDELHKVETEKDPSPTTPGSRPSDFCQIHTDYLKKLSENRTTSDYGDKYMNTDEEYDIRMILDSVLRSRNPE